jgi:Tfp pilus assembly protein PilV
MSGVRRTTGNESGFSLVELMVAMGFIGAGLLSLAQLFVLSIKHTDVARKDTAAMNLSSEIVERMRSVEYDDMVTIFDNIDTKNPTTVPVESRDWADHLVDQLGNGARGRVDIVNNADGRQDLARIDVVITWVDRGDTLNTSTSVYVSKMGV